MLLPLTVLLSTLSHTFKSLCLPCRGHLPPETGTALSPRQQTNLPSLRGSGKSPPPPQVSLVAGQARRAALTWLSYSSPASRSPSPPARRPRPSSPPINVPRLPDNDPARRRERERQMAATLDNQNRDAIVIKPKADPVAEMKKLATTRGGGAYIPPHRLRAMLAEQEAENKEGEEYQRLTWEALRKSINGLINKVNTSNIKLLIPEVRPAPLRPSTRFTLTFCGRRRCSARTSSAERVSSSAR